MIRKNLSKEGFTLMELIILDGVECGIHNHHGDSNANDGQDEVPFL